MAGATQLPHAAPDGLPARLRRPAALPATRSNLAVLQRELHPAGIVLEHVTGRTYVELVQERVFDRAGMSASGFRLDEPHPEVAVGYLDPDSPGAIRRTNIYSVPVIGGPDGGAFGTVTDLDRFLHHLADTSLMGEITAEMLDPREILGDGYRHAYGFIYHPDGWFGHGGGDPGVACRVQCFPDDDANLIVLCNVETWAGELRDAVVQTWRGP